MATCFHPYSPEDIQRTQELKELTELFAPMFGTTLSANINDIIGAWQETKEARGMLPSNEDFFEFLFNGIYNKPQVPKHLIKEVVAAHAEMAEIRAEAIKNGTYLKAPNGKRSNLNERQWLQVRTKAFKDWFGDWEKLAAIDERQIEQIYILFDKFPELSKIGTTREYAAYLKTIFPNTVIDNIVYRGSNEKDLLLGKGFNGELYFSPIYEATLGYKEQSKGNIYAAILNVTNPFNAKNQRETQENIPQNYDATLNYVPNRINFKNFKYIDRMHEFIEKNKSAYTDDKKLIKDAKKYGSNSVFEEEYGKGHEIGIHHSNIENVLPEIKVKNKSQVYLLGTKDDINNFKQWLEKNNISKVVDENGEPLEVYHTSKSSEAKPITVFTKQKGYKANNFFYFSNNKESSQTYYSAVKYLGDEATRNELLEELIQFYDLNKKKFTTLKSVQEYLENELKLNNNRINEITNKIRSNTNGIKVLGRINLETGEYTKDASNESLENELSDLRYENNRLEARLNKIYNYVRVESGEGKTILDLNTYSTFLNLRNPLIINAGGRDWHTLDMETFGREYDFNPENYYYKNQNNNDGFILSNIMDESYEKGKIISNTFAVSNSNQIKSATDNIGTFREDNDNIYYQKPIRTELQKLKTINTPLKTRGSIKNIKEALKRTGVSPLIYNTIIKAIETDPNLAELTPRDLFQLISSARYKDIEMDYHKSIEEPIIEELENHLKEFLKKFKVSFVDGAKLCEEQGVFGAYDILNKVIYLAKNRNAITAPEEAAHAIVELLGAKPHKNADKFPETKDMTFLLNHVEKTAIYKRVLEEYSKTYVKKDGTPDILKIKKEAIGQALAVAIKNNWEHNTLEEENSFWGKLKDLFNRIISIFSDTEYLSFESLLNTIAKEVISNDYSRFEKVDSSKYSILDFGETLAEQNKKDKGKVLSFLQWFSSIGNIITGSLAYRKQGSVYRGSLDALHDIDMIVPFETHSIDMNNADFKTLVQQSEESEDQTTLSNYILNTEYFKKIKAKYPKVKFGNAFSQFDYITVNAVYSENEELSNKFLRLSGSYAHRLNQFTEEERAQIYLFDFFLKPEGSVTDTIEDSEYGLSLAHWKHSMIEKVFNMGRAKDIFDYQSWEIFEEYKENIPSEKEFLMFQKQPLNKGENISSNLPGPETKINIYAGANENADLSNFAERPFDFDEDVNFERLDSFATSVEENNPLYGALDILVGKSFSSVEAAFQYAKFGVLKREMGPWTTEEKSLQETIKKAKGSQAKTLGKQIKDLDTKAWDIISSQVMKFLIKESFIQNPEALKSLLDTGDATLIHLSKNQKAMTPAQLESAKKKDKWIEEFPKLLMEVREELRGQALNNINLKRSRKTYSGMIDTLNENQIFVFGSNTQGRHGKGAAKTAVDKFKAVYGQAEGVQGQSYAIITKDLTKDDKKHPSRTKEEIKEQIHKLYEFAKQHPDKEFLVAYSKEGKNLNYYSNEEMAEMFASEEVPSNIIFEEGFNSLVFSAEISTNTSTIKESVYYEELNKVLEQKVAEIEEFESRTNDKSATPAKNLYKLTIDANKAVLEVIRKGGRTDKDISADTVNKQIQGILDKTPKSLGDKFIQTLKDMSNTWGNTSTQNLTANYDAADYIKLEDYLAQHGNKIQIKDVTYIIQKTKDSIASYVVFREGPNKELISITPFEINKVFEALRRKLQLGLNTDTNLPIFEPSKTSTVSENKLNEAVEEEQALGETLKLTAPQIEEIENVLLYELLEYAYDARGFKGKVCIWLEEQLNSEEVSEEQKAVYAEALQQISLFKKVYSDYNNILPKELQKSSFTAFLSNYLRSFVDINTFVKNLATKVNITPEHPRYQEFINANLTRMNIYFGWVKSISETSPEQYEKIEDIFIKNTYSKFEQLTGYKISYKRKKAANTEDITTPIEETVTNTFGSAFAELEQLRQELETTSIQTEDLSAEEASETENLNDVEEVGEAYAQGNFEDSLKQSSFSTLSSSLKLLYAMYLKQGYYNNEKKPVYTPTLIGRRKSVNPRKVHGVLSLELANCTTFEQMIGLLKRRLKKKYVWAELLADLLTGTCSLGYSKELLGQLQNQFFNAYGNETTRLVRVNHTVNDTYVQELGTHSGTQQLYDALHETFSSAGYIVYNEKNSLYNSDGTLNIIKLSEEVVRTTLKRIYQDPLTIDALIANYKEEQGDGQGNIYLTPLESLCLEADSLANQIVAKMAKEDVSADWQKLSEYFQQMLLGIGVPIHEFPELTTILEDPEILTEKDAQGISFFRTLLNTLNYFSAPPMYLHKDKILYENHSQQEEDTTKVDPSTNSSIQQVTVEADKQGQIFDALFKLIESQKGRASFAWDIKTLYKQNYSNLFRLLGPHVAPTVEGMVQERGQTYYPFQPSSYGGNLISDLANDSNLSDAQYQQWMEQTFSKDPLLATINTEGGKIKWLHPILNHLYNNPKHAKLIKKQTVKFVDRKESKDWTDLDYLMLMEDLANTRATPTDKFYRTFLLPVISDKQAVEVVVSPVQYLFDSEDLFDAKSFTDKGRQAIRSILEAEYNRIAKFSEIANEINKETELGQYYKEQIGSSYLKRAATWTVFPELNDFAIKVVDSSGIEKTLNFYDLITKQKEGDNNITINTGAKMVSLSPTEYIYSTLYELLDKRFNRFQAKLKQESDLAKQAGKSVKELEGFGSHQSLKNLYVWDTLQQVWWSQLLLGDGANYKDAVDMTKRTNQMHSGTNKINTGNPELTGDTYDSGKLVKEKYVILADPQAKSEHRDKEIAQIIKNLKLSEDEKTALKSVWKTTMDLTDGLSVRSLASYKKILIMAGMDSLEIERIFNNFKNGKFVYADLEKILVSLKPFYVGEEIQTVKDKNNNVVYTSRKILQHKNQEALLCIRDILRTAINNSGFYKELQTFMEKNEVDLILFNSNVKVGGTPAITLSKDIQKLSEGEINGKPLSEYLEEKITERPFLLKERALKYYGISTATDDHLTDKSRTRGTQMVRLMLSDLKVIEEENTPQYKQFVNNYKPICENQGLLTLKEGRNGKPYYAYTNTFIDYVKDNFGIDIQDYTKDEAFPFFLEYLMVQGKGQKYEFKYSTKNQKKDSGEVYVLGEDSEGNTSLNKSEGKENTLELSLTPIYYKVGDKEFTSLQLRILYQKLLLEGVRRAKERFDKSFDSIEEVQKLIFDFIDSSNRYSAELKECFKIVERKVKGKTVKEFALGFGDPLRAHDLEPLLLALVKDRILTQTTRGGDAVQVSSVGATDLHMRFQNSDGAFIFNEKEWNDPSLAEASMREVLNDLKKEYSSYKEYSDSVKGQASSIAYLECYLPPHVKELIPFALVKKTTDEGSYYELDYSKIPAGLRTAIGYRIPTENKYSITNLRVKGFLPPGSATVMLPHEWLILSGSDFDIDKLYLIFKELKKTKPDLDQFFKKEDINYNGKKENISYWEIFLNVIQHDFLKNPKKEILDKLRNAKNTKDVKAILKNYKDLDFKGFLEQFETTLIALWQEGHDINIFPYEVPEFDWDSYMKDPTSIENQTMAQCNNAVFDIMQTIMASKESVNTILQSNNIKPLVELASDITIWKNLSAFKDYINKTLNSEDAESIGERLTHLENQKTGAKYSEPIWENLGQFSSDTKNSFISTVNAGKDFYDITDRVTRWRNNMDGSNLIAPHAIHNVHIGVAQGINYPIPPFTIAGVTYNSISNKYNADGSLISPALAMNVAGAVDNGKQPTLGTLMQHPKVVHITDYMLRAGVDKKIVAQFLSHPDISNILNLSRYSDKSVRTLILQAIKNLQSSYKDTTGQELKGIANFSPDPQDLAMACLDPKFIEQNNLEPKLLEAPARLQMLRLLENIEQGAMDLSNQVRGSRSDSLKNASYIYKYADKQKGMDKALGKINNPNAIYLKGLNDMGWHTVTEKYSSFHPIIKNLEAIQEFTQSYTPAVLNEWMLNYQYFQALQLSFFNDMSAEKLHITHNVQNETLKNMFNAWNGIPDFDSLEAKQKWFSLEFPTFVSKTLNVLQDDKKGFVELFIHNNTLNSGGMKTRSFLLDLQVSSKTKKRARQSIGISNFKNLKLQEGYLATIQQQVVDMSKGKGILNEQIAKDKGLTPDDITALNIFLKNLINNLFIFEVMTSAFERSTNSIASIFGAQYLTNIPGYGEVLQKGDDSLMRVYHTQFILNKLGRVGFVKEINPEVEDGKKLLDIIQKYKKGESTVVPKEYWDNLSFGSQSEIVKIKDKTRTVFVGCIEQDIVTQRARLGIINSMGKYGTYNEYNPFMDYPLFQSPAFMQDAEELYFPMDLVYPALAQARQQGDNGQLVVETPNNQVALRSTETGYSITLENIQKEVLKIKESQNYC